MNNINYSSYSHHNGGQDEAAVVLVTSAKKGDIYRRGSAANLLFLETLQKTHASFVVEMQDADIKSAIRFAKKKIGKPITVLAILGHGNPDLIQLADGNEGLYRIENVRAQDFRDLSRNAFIYLGSCHSANFAKMITLKTGLVTAASFASVSVGLSFLIPRREDSNSLHLVHQRLL